MGLINISNDEKFTEKTALVFMILTLIIGGVVGYNTGYYYGYNDGFDFRGTVEPHDFDDDKNNEVIEPIVSQTENEMYWYVVLENGDIITYPPGTDEFEICKKHIGNIENCTFVWESLYQGEVKRRTHYIGEL